MKLTTLLMGSTFFVLVSISNVFGYTHIIDLPEVVNQVDDFGNYSFNVSDSFLTEFESIDQVQIVASGFGEAYMVQYEEIWEWIDMGRGEGYFELVDVIEHSIPSDSIVFLISLDDAYREDLFMPMGDFNFSPANWLTGAPWDFLLDGTAVLEISALAAFYDRTNLRFDQFSLAIEGTVPEPASILLLTSGLFFLRRKSSSHFR